MRVGGKHNDLDNVGHTARHHTFFEMCGNFTFGAQAGETGDPLAFKKEAVGHAWTFLTRNLSLPQDRLRVSVLEGDEETAGVWTSTTGLPESSIIECGPSDNFWSMGDDPGPCGPCTEIFYDQGVPDTDGDPWLEVWNVVFMQSLRAADGSMSPLEHPCVDTGMGLGMSPCLLH
jgi:alanyl-tRNA synthetase